MSRFNLSIGCNDLLEEYGGEVANRSCRILLEDNSLRDLKRPLDWISKNWRDPLTPTMMALSCEAVGGKQEDTKEVALAVSLMQLSFFVWDEIVDRSKEKMLKPTLFGQFGDGTALIVGGLASAKAFSIINKVKIERSKSELVTDVLWDFWAKMAYAETVNLEMRKNCRSSRNKLWVYTTEGMADLGSCMRIGAIMGNGSKEETDKLADFGMCLCTMLDLWKGFLLSINFTLDLPEKLSRKALPYQLLWAQEKSEELRKDLEKIWKTEKILPRDIDEIVAKTIRADVFEKTEKTIGSFAKRAKEDLFEIKESRAVQKLQEIIASVEEQPALFRKEFSMI